MKRQSRSYKEPDIFRRYTGINNNVLRFCRFSSTGNQHIHPYERDGFGHNQSWPVAGAYGSNA